MGNSRYAVPAHAQNRALSANQIHLHRNRGSESERVAIASFRKTPEVGELADSL